MWVEHLRFSVVGEPRTQGSKRGFAVRRGGVPTGQVVIREDNPKVKDWRLSVSSAALEAVGETPILDEAVYMEVTFFLSRPKGDYGTGKNARQLKPSAPPFPHKGRDCEKLQRAIGDALTKIVYRDDSRVVWWNAMKEFADDHGRRVGADVVVYRWEGPRPTEQPKLFGEDGEPAPTPKALQPPAPEHGMDHVRNAYPAHRRGRRDDLQVCWDENDLEPKADLILRWLEFDKRSDEWTKDEGKWVPGICKWLSRERWSLGEPPAAELTRAQRDSATIARLAARRKRNQDDPSREE